MAPPDASAMVAQFARLQALEPENYDRIVAQPEGPFPNLPPLVIDDLCAVYGDSWRLLPHVERWVRRYLHT